MTNDVIEGNEQATYVALRRISVTYRGITYQARACAVSHDTASLAQPGRTGGMFLGQQLTRSRKTMVDKSLLITR